MIKKIFPNRAGLTFIEMIMAIAIFSMGIAGFTLLFSRTWQSNSYVLEMGKDSMAASQGVSNMADYIRRARQGDDGSYPVQLADENELTIFSDYNKDGVTDRLHFYKSDQSIMMGITEPAATFPVTYPAGDQTVVTLAEHVANDSAAPIFSYYNKNYPADTTNNPMSVPASVADVRLVKVYLEVNIDPNNAPNSVHMQSFVEMRNLNDYNEAG